MCFWAGNPSQLIFDAGAASFMRPKFIRRRSVTEFVHVECWSSQEDPTIRVLARSLRDFPVIYRSLEWIRLGARPVSSETAAIIRLRRYHVYRDAVPFDAQDFSAAPAMPLSQEG